MSLPDCATASALLIDDYQLTMAEAYLACGHTEPASFEFFVRKLPSRRGFLLAAGLEQALEFLETFAFSATDLDWLATHGGLRPRTIDWLAEVRFRGEVDAMPEGSVFFADEPILRVTAPLPVAQLVETRLMNILHFQTVVASKAARMTLAARGRTLVDFGLRRAHGAEAGLLAARASYIAGFSATATVAAGRLWDIPLTGTMAHSFIQSFDDEARAFVAFAQARPENLTLLIDTYDTEAAARSIVALARRRDIDPARIRAVRIDSGDLLALSRGVRAILDDGGLGHVGILASGGLDEDDLAGLVAAGAPIDGFGVGASLTTSSDAPALDCAYKLQEYAGVARRKLSAGKSTWPGRKQVWRAYGADGRMQGDVLTVDDDRPGGEPLLGAVMREGRRTPAPPSLPTIRAEAARGLARLPEPLRRLEAWTYPVEVSPALRALAREVDARRAPQEPQA